MSSEDEYAGSGQSENCAEERSEEFSQDDGNNDLDAEVFPSSSILLNPGGDSDTTSSGISALTPKLPISNSKPLRVRLYGRAPNPSFTLNGVEYVLQRRQRPRHRTEVLRKDTFVVVRLPQLYGRERYTKAVARTLTSLPVPTLNECFDIDTYLASTSVEVEVFDIKAASNQDSIVGRTLFYPRSEKISLYLKDITAFAEVFKPKQGDILIHGLIPGAQANLELACTEDVPSRVIPLKMWKRTKLYITKMTLEMGAFPFSPLFLINPNLLPQTVADQIQDFEPLYDWMNKQYSALLSLTSQPFVENGYLDICQRINAAIVLGGSTVCTLLDTLWKYYSETSIPAPTFSIDLPQLFLCIILYQHTPTEKCLSELSLLSRWCLDFSSALAALDSTAKHRKKLGLSFLKCLFPHYIYLIDVFLPLWAHSCAVERVMSSSLLSAIYNMESELLNSQPIWSDSVAAEKFTCASDGLSHITDPTFKLWLQFFDDSVRSGNYEYAYFIVSKGKTDKGNAFAPLGLISLSKKLTFAEIDFDISSDMILRTPKAISKYVTTAPIDWVMLSGNADILSGFLTIHAQDGFSMDFNTKLQKIHTLAASGWIATIRDIPQTLMEAVNIPCAVALILGSMMSGNMDQLSSVLTSLYTARPRDEPLLSFSLFVFDVVKAFIDKIVLRQSFATTDTMTIKSLLDILKQLFTPTIYQIFSVEQRVELLSAVIASRLEQDIIIELIDQLLVTTKLLYCSTSGCILKYCLANNKLHVAAYLLYKLFIDPVKHASSWLSSLESYTDGVILHFTDTLFRRATATEYDILISALRESIYAILVKQMRFDSLRAIEAHIKGIVLCLDVTVNVKVKPFEEDVINIYLNAQRSSSPKIQLTEAIVNSLMTLVDIFGPTSLNSIASVFEMGTLAISESFESLWDNKDAVSLDQLIACIDEFIVGSAPILSGLLSLLLKLLEYTLSPLTEEERKAKVKRPSLNFLSNPSILTLLLLSVESSVEALHNYAERQLVSCDLTESTLLEFIRSGKRNSRISTGISMLAALQTILKNLLSDYHRRLPNACCFAKNASTQLISLTKNAVIDYFTFILIQRAIMNTFVNSKSVFTCKFMSLPSIAASTNCVYPFGIDLLLDLDLQMPACSSLNQLRAYSPNTLCEEILQRIITIEGIVNLSQEPLELPASELADTKLFNVPVITNYSRFLSKLAAPIPLQTEPKTTLCEQISAFTSSYKDSISKKNLESGEDSSLGISSLKFIDTDLITAPKRPQTFRGDTILHVLFSKFKFTSENADYKLFSQTLGSISKMFSNGQSKLRAFSCINSSFKTPLQMLQANSLEHAVSILRIIFDIDPILLFPYAESLVDLPSLLHHFIFSLVRNSVEHILLQLFEYAPKTIMRDLLMAPCHSESNSILLTALLKRGIGDVDHLIDLYQQYGCLEEAVIAQNSGGWCAVTIALQNQAIQEVPAALVEAAMKAPMDALVNRYGHTPLHSLFFDDSLVLQSPEGENNYTYTYQVLTTRKVDPVFKLSAAQKLARMDSVEDVMCQLDRFGMTPLHYAITCSAFVCTQSLLAKYCPVHLLDRTGLDKGVTPLELALTKKSEEMSQLLIQKGANPLRRTSTISFLGEPLTVFSRLIQNGYLNLAYTVIHQHTSMSCLLLNEALHANSSNAKPILRALLTGVDEATASYLALSIAGNQIDRRLIDALLDTMHGIYATSGKKFHMTNWLATFTFAQPSRWFTGDDSIYEIFFKIAMLTNFAKDKPDFNLRLIMSSIPVKLLSRTLRIRHLISTVKTNNDVEDESSLSEKASPVELMLLKLYSGSARSLFQNKEFLHIFQLYVCKHLHISALIPRLLDDFLTAAQTATLTKEKVDFFHNFFSTLISMLDTEDCLIPGLSVKVLRLRTREFISKLISVDSVLTKLFTTLTFSSALYSGSSTRRGGVRLHLIGESSNGNVSDEDYIPCCLNILKCYIATNSVSWSLLFSSVYGLHHEFHQSPKRVVQAIFDQLKSVAQISKPAMKTVLEAALSKIQNLYWRGCTKAVVAEYLSDLLEAADCSSQYEELVDKILKESNPLVEPQCDDDSMKPDIEITNENINILMIEQEYARNRTYIENTFVTTDVFSPNPREVIIHGIPYWLPTKQVELLPQTFTILPNQSYSVLHKQNLPLRVGEHYYQFMLGKAFLKKNALLLTFHEYTLEFDLTAKEYYIFYRTAKYLAAFRGECFMQPYHADWSRRKRILTYSALDQAIKGFLGYFKKKSGLSFEDCCAHGVPKAHYETAGDKSLLVCSVGKASTDPSDMFIEATEDLLQMFPDLAIYQITSSIVDEINSEIMPKLPQTENKDWRALKILSSIVQSSFTLNVEKLGWRCYNNPCHTFMIICLQRALEAYEKKILPMLESSDFLKVVASVEDFNANTDTAENPYIKKVINYGMYLFSASGLSISLYPIFVIYSQLALLNLKVFFAGIRTMLDGVRKSSLLLFAGLRYYADPSSKLSVKSMKTLVACVLGLQFDLIDEQTNFVMRHINGLEDQALLCRVYGFRDDGAYETFLQLVHSLSQHISKGRQASPESWINTYQLENEDDDKRGSASSKQKIDWNSPHLFWTSDEENVSPFISLLTGVSVPIIYRDYSQFNCNQHESQPFGVETFARIRYSGISYGLIIDNISDYIHETRRQSSKVMKVVPGFCCNSMYTYGRPLQEFISDGFKYVWAESDITAVSFTPRATRIKYIALL